MTFSSIPFLFYFLPLFLIFYAVAPAKNAALLGASLLFYAWGEPAHILFLLVLLAANHVLARAIARSGDNCALIAGVVLNLAGLAWFKYAGFAAASVLSVFGRVFGDAFGGDSGAVFQPHLPLGISFYTFQAISLLADVRRRDGEAPRNVVDTALYISMFPQLIAGPIVRFKEIDEQLRQRTHSAEKFAAGARLFVLGLAQKTLLANSFAGVADAAFDAPQEAALGAGAAWLGLAAYSLQIYFDFAGYSNMAIGMGRFFGFELPRNFDFPYAAQSVTEFWRRWHMTLSRWFRDYLYIPLGGNRGSALQTYRNLWIVFLLCGLWHGAAWTFLFWGAWHGAFLVLERAFLLRRLDRAPRFLRHLYLPLIVALGWIPFRAETLPRAADYAAAMFGFANGDYAVTVRDVAPEGFASVLAIGAAAAFWPLARESAGALARRAAPMRFPTLRLSPGEAARFAAGQAALVLLFVLCAASLAGGAYNPFIYFRF